MPLARLGIALGVSLVVGIGVIIYEFWKQAHPEHAFEKPSANSSTSSTPPPYTPPESKQSLKQRRPSKSLDGEKDGAHGTSTARSVEHEDNGNLHHRSSALRTHGDDHTISESVHGTTDETAPAYPPPLIQNSETVWKADDATSMSSSASEEAFRNNDLAQTVYYPSLSSTHQDVSASENINSSDINSVSQSEPMEEWTVLDSKMSGVSFDTASTSMTSRSPSPASLSSHSANGTSYASLPLTPVQVVPEHTIQGHYIQNESSETRDREEVGGDEGSETSEGSSISDLADYLSRSDHSLSQSSDWSVVSPTTYDPSNVFE